jgi:trehalose-6-phosphate synthase
LHPFNNSTQEHDELKWVNPTDTEVLITQLRQGMKARNEEEEMNMPGIIAYSTLHTMLRIASRLEAASAPSTQNNFLT